MRIVSGSAKGQNIEAPQGLNTRPVTDKIRQSLFNIWQFDIPESSFLDLFSGSGSMGLEALSRGANDVCFVEMGDEAFECIGRNLKKLNVNQHNARALKLDVLQAIDLLGHKQNHFDFIYADPPFTNETLYAPLMEKLDGSSLLDEDGVLAVRAHKDFVMPENLENLELVREKKYGISKVYFYRRKA